MLRSEQLRMDVRKIIAAQACILLLVSVVTADDQEVLLAFKDSINDPKGVLDDWISGTSICNWTGVTCLKKSRTETVWFLLLMNHSLSGTIPPVLGRLKSIQILSLWKNMFTGAIPSELGNCTDLIGLYLQSNQLSGNIPDMFSGLTKLAGLYLWENKLEGIVPHSLSNCTAMRWLALADNQLSGNILFISNMVNLERVSLYMNRFIHQIPEEVGNMTYLQYLSFHTNNISGNIPESIGKLQKLWLLNLENNNLYGSIPEALGNCRRMRELTLGVNKLTGRIPVSLGHLKKLQILELPVNQLSGSIPPSLGNCSNLVHLGIAMNFITGSIPYQLGNLGELQYLTLSYNNLTGSIPSTLGNLSLLYNMDLFYNQLSGNIPSSFGFLSSIQGLFLDYNILTGSIPSSLGSCKRLSQFSCCFNRLEGTIPGELTDIPSLTYLVLDHNQLTGEIPAQIGDLVRLLILKLSFNRLTGSLPSTLANLRELRLLLDLSHNQLAGNIPPWIGVMGSVQNMSLGSNNFTGQIPTSLGKCTGLQVLDLSMNGLTGSIPEELGQLKLISALDLSNNHLSGQIPGSFKSLNFLDFNVSTNNLEGAIPDEGPFKMLNNTSFLNNPKLCGRMVNRTCKPKIKASHGFPVLDLAVVIAVVLFSGSIFIFIILVLKKKRTKKFMGNSHMKSYTPEELRTMTNDFSEERLIGHGGQSRVYKGTTVSNGQTGAVAIKILHQVRVNDQETRRSFMTEASLLGRLKHRNLVSVLGFCWTTQLKAVVLEYMVKGSLKERLTSLTWHQKLNIALGVAQGVLYLHEEYGNTIIHCDLKPGNILLDDDLEAHLADFGISKLLQGENINSASASVFRGTIGYAPPEYGTNARVSTKGDVYSYGVLLLEMVTLKSPTGFDEGRSLRDWALESLLSNLKDVVISDSDDHEEVKDKMKDLLQIGLLCTENLPANRPSMKEVVAMITQTKQGMQLGLKDFPTLEALALVPSSYTSTSPTSLL